MKNIIQSLRNRETLGNGKCTKELNQLLEWKTATKSTVNLVSSNIWVLFINRFFIFSSFNASSGITFIYWYFSSYQAKGPNTDENWRTLKRCSTIWKDAEDPKLGPKHSKSCLHQKAVSVPADFPIVFGLPFPIKNSLGWIGAENNEVEYQVIVIQACL